MTPFRLALIGLVLLVISGLVTGFGQVATEGGLLTGFVVVQSALALLWLAGLAALHSGRRRIRRGGELIFVLFAIWFLVIALGMVFELFSGRAPYWLWLDLLLTAITGVLAAMAARQAWIEDRA